MKYMLRASRPGAAPRGAKSEVSRHASRTSACSASPSTSKSILAATAGKMAASHIFRCRLLLGEMRMLHPQHALAKCRRVDAQHHPTLLQLSIVGSAPMLMAMLMPLLKAPSAPFWRTRPLALRGAPTAAPFHFSTA